MSDTSTIQQGWLETREGDKFAPNTLIENVYTRSGQKYDARVREYIASIQSGASSDVTALQQRMNTAERNIQIAQDDIDNIEADVAAKFNNFNTDNSDTFWIIDNNSEVIAYVDVNGVHSFDFETKGGVKLSEIPTQLTSLSGQISALDSEISNAQVAIKNFNGEDSEVLYVIDGNNEVIAYINSQGVHSYNFYVAHKNEQAGAVDDYRTLAGKVIQNISDISTNEGAITALENRLGTVENNTQYFNGNDDDTLYIVDGTDDKNVIAYFDGEGLHVINVLIGSRDSSGNVVNRSYDLYTTLVKLEQDIADELRARKEKDDELAGKITTNEGNIAALMKAIDPDAIENKLFFIDNNNNVIAYIDELGIHAVDLHIGNSATEGGTSVNGNSYSVYDELTKLLATDTGTIADLQSQISALGLRIDTLETWQQQINTWQTATNTNISNLQIAVDTTLPNSISEVAQEAATNLSNAIDAEVSNRNAAIKTAVDNEAAARMAKDNELAGYITTNEGNISKLMNAINPDKYDNKLFFIDNNNNVIAYIDELGLHTVNVFVGGSGEVADDGTIIDPNNNYNVYAELEKLLATEGAGSIADLQSQISALGLRTTNLETWQSQMQTWQTGVNTDISNIKGDITNLQTAVNETLPNQINGVATTAQSNLEAAITKEVTDRNAAITSAVNAETAIRSAQDEIIYSILGENTKITDNAKTHKSRLDSIETRLTNVSNVMDFVGVFNELPTAANYQKGDVCVVEGIEYVHDGSSWQQLGDVTRLAAVESALDTETQERIAADQNLSDRITPLENIVGGEGDTLYIIDGTNDQNVIAYFNEEGLTTYNVIVKNTQLNKSKNTQVNGIFINGSNTVTIGFEI